MRIATYNVEWFDALFDDDNTMLFDSQKSGRHGVTRGDQLDALGHVFKALDADLVMVVEAPDTHKSRDTRVALARFAAHFGLRANACETGFVNQTQQEIACLYDPKSLQLKHDPIGQPTGKKGSPDAPRFDGVFRWDLDVDAKSDPIRFSKPPLELAVETTAGHLLRMIGVHVKSKAPHGARNAADVMRISIDNRRKQLAQCIWLRARVDYHLEQGDSLIVLGDLNDGPGLDEYEQLFGRSGVEILLGEADGARLYDPHAQQAISRRGSAAPTTARFYLGKNRRYLQALLDYIMVSADLRARNPVWRIWHPFEDPDCFRDKPICDALLTASDHFPVSLDIEL